MMMNAQPWLLALLTLAALPVANAQPTHPERASEDVALQDNTEESVDDNSKQLARSLYAEGVRFARAGDYQKAKEKFLAAYSAAPHFLVFYNIAQANIELGETAAAVHYLKRYLSESGDELSAELRRKAEDQLQRLEAVSAEPVSPTDRRTTEPNESQETTFRHSDAVTHQAVKQPGTQRPIRNDQGRKTNAKGTTNPAGDPRNPRITTAAYLVGSAGVALLATGIGLHLWNSTRHSEWRAENEQLRNRQSELLSARMEPRENRDFAARVSQNDELLASIQTLDTWTMLGAGAGTAALGLSVWLFVGSDGQHELVTTGHSVEWRGTW